MKGIYLAAKEHRIKNVNLDYNDIEKYEGINIVGDMLTVNLEKYDYIIATPPCNYYSRANYRRETSEIAQTTKHLLPEIIKKCEKLNKPFIIENVCNNSLLPKSNSYEFNFGQHHFYTNVFMLIPHKSYAEKQYKQKLQYGKRDNNKNVQIIIDIFLEMIGAINDL